MDRAAPVFRLDKHFFHLRNLLYLIPEGKTHFNASRTRYDILSLSERYGGRCIFKFLSKTKTIIFRLKFRIFAHSGAKICLRYPNEPFLFGSQTTNKKETFIMSSKNSNKLNIPEARQAMDKFKMEAASEARVPPPS